MKWEEIYHYFDAQNDLRELIIQGHLGCFLISSGSRQTLESPFKSAREAEEGVQNLILSLGERLDPRYPAHGGTIEGRYRWHAVMAPVVTNGAVLSIRKQSIWQLDDFDDPLNLLPRIIHHVEDGKPLVVCGLTGSGKTSFLQAILTQCFHKQRVIIIETLAEITPTSPEWLCLHTSPTDYDGHSSLSVRDLFAQTLRLLPDKIVFAELRVEEAPVFFESVYAGYGATLATLHCSSHRDIYKRLQTLLGSQSLSQAIEGTMLAACYLRNAVKPILTDFQAIDLNA
jgi:pilus assembly protein CpaF